MVSRATPKRRKSTGGKRKPKGRKPTAARAKARPRSRPRARPASPTALTQKMPRRPARPAATTRKLPALRSAAVTNKVTNKVTPRAVARGAASRPKTPTPRRLPPRPTRPAPAPAEGLPPAYRPPALELVPEPGDAGIALSGSGATTTLLQTIELPGSPDAIYAAYVSADLHAAFTGAPAMLEPRVGGTMSAWDGYITGRFERLDQGRRIVQTWQTLEWPAGFQASRLELSLSPAEGGTRVTMVHAGVPTEQARRYDEGWRDHYWEPLRRWLLDART